MSGKTGKYVADYYRMTGVYHQGGPQLHSSFTSPQLGLYVLVQKVSGKTELFLASHAL